MIGFLEGEVAYLTPQSVLLNVQGVGYEVRVHDRLHAQLREKSETRLRITTHLIAKDDGMELFGFQSPQEKEIFLQLTRVSGIGPRTALAIFSLLDFTEIVRAIVSNQPGVLSRAPGVGKKTAQRIILELKEKLSKQHAETLSGETVVDSGLPTQWQEEIEMTLLALGFSPPEVQKGLQFASTHTANAGDLDDVLRAILTELSD